MQKCQTLLCIGSVVRTVTQNTGDLAVLGSGSEANCVHTQCCEEMFLWLGYKSAILWQTCPERDLTSSCSRVFVFFACPIITLDFPFDFFFQVLSFPRDVCQQTLSRSTLLLVPDVRKLHLPFCSPPHTLLEVSLPPRCHKPS